MTVPGPGLAFIHGAGLGGWIWEDVAPLVARPCLPTDFPHRDGDPSTRKGLSLDDYAADVEAQIAAWEAEKVIIVAHSIGGVVGLKVAERLGERLAGFVAVSASIPRDGGSFVSSLPLPNRVLMTVVTRVVGTQPPEAALRKGLCNDLPEALADEVVERFTPESRSLYVDRADGGPPPVPRTYIRLTNDNEFDSRVQTAMARNLETDDIREVASGHLPMLGKPAQLAQVLNEFSAAVAGAQ
jgi:pimeloyl-ACP methyl ester carboxylesterase